MYSRPKLFLSYNWSSLNEANRLESELSERGILVTRDINDLGAWDSLQGFMASIREHDYAVLLISEAYLHSKNCMDEALQAFSMDGYETKIFPVVLSKEIYSTLNHLSYSKYWADKCTEFATQMLGLEWTDERLSEMKKLQSISSSISKLLTWISDTNNPSLDCAADKIVTSILRQSSGTYILKDSTAGSSESEGFAVNHCRNELINWYFCNPVNQRKQDQYTVDTSKKSFSGQYTIDRWLLDGMNKSTIATVYLRDTGIECRCRGEGSLATFSQPIECFGRYAGRTVTISADVSEIKNLKIWIGVGYLTPSEPNIYHYERALVQSSGISYLTIQLPHDISGLRACVMLSNENDNNESYTIVKSMKLELSDETSLSSDIAPIFHEELAKCQRYGLLLPLGHLERAVDCSQRQMVFKSVLPIALRTIPTLIARQDHALSHYPDFDGEVVKTNIIDIKYEIGLKCLYLFTENIHSWPDATLTLSSDVFLDGEIYH